MGKRLVLFLAVMLMAVSCFAEEPQSKEFYTINIDNTSGIYTSTLVPLTTIYPNGTDQIIGFTVAPLATASENVAALYDSSTTALSTSAEFIGEAECAPESFDGLWFPYPRPLANGLVVRQGPNTRVIIYWIRG